MGDYKPQIKDGTTRLFSNQVLEKITRTNTVVPVTIFSVFSIALLYLASVNATISLWSGILVFLSGWFTFTLVEYLTHKYFFHMLPNTKLKEKIQYAFHGVHHDYPKDKDRLAMPPLVSILIGIVLFYISRLLMGDFAFTFLPGFMTGYALYLTIHYAVHAYQPPKNFLRVLWVNHGIHHYKDHERAFGVTSPLWDYIFRTLPRKTHTPKH